MLKEITVTKLYTIIFCLFAFSFSWNLTISTYLLILLGILWFSDKQFKIGERFKMAFSDKNVLILMSTFVVGVLGLLNSSDVEHGVFILGVSFSLFVNPIMFKSIGKSEFKTKNIHAVFVAFVLGSFTSALYCLIKSWIDYASGSENGLNEFYYVYLMEVPLSPGSFANYLMMSIIILLAYLAGEYKFLPKRKVPTVVLAILLLFFFIAFLFLLQAKAAILGLFIIFGLLFLYKLSKIFSRKFALLTCLVAVVGVGFFVKSGGLKMFGKRFEDISISSDFSRTSYKSTHIRLSAIHGSIHLIKEHPIIGVGTGSVKGELIKFYTEYGYKGALFHKTDTHNQFLRSFAKNGIFGFIALLLTFILPIVIAVKKHSLILYLLSVNQIVMAMAGDILDNQPGVVFHAFTVCFIVFIAVQHKPKLEEEKA